MDINDKIQEAQNTFLDGCWDRVRHYYEKRISNKNAIIYGAGVYAQFLYKSFKELNIDYNLFCFINDYIENEEYLFDVPVLKYSELNNKSDYVYIIGIQNCDAIINKLSADNCEYIVTDYDTSFYENNLMYSFYKCIESSPIANMFNKIADYYINYYDDFDSKVLDFYDEDISRNIIKNRLDFYKTGDCSLIDEMPKNYNQYFDNEYYDIRDNEVFVDCGAYDGDSIIEFNEYVSGKYQKIYAIEPDKISLKKLREKTEAFHDIEVFECATGSENGKLRFESKGVLGSRESDSGDEIDVRKLDDLLLGKNVSLIKMDIEGAELDTLKGASGIIKACKPKLAICIYHKIEDIYTIPSYIHSIVPEYRFKVRQHSDSMNETVLYAEV